MSADFQALREACCEANIALSRSGLVDLTFGNVSVLDPEAGVFAIKPSGVPDDSLRPSDIVVAGLDGRKLWGTLRPSSDEPTHRRLLAAFAEHGVVSIVHTQSRPAVAFAQAGREIPPLGTTHADHFRGPVPVTRGLEPGEVASAYEWETAGVILEAFETSALRMCRRCSCAITAPLRGVPRRHLRSRTRWLSKSAPISRCARWRSRPAPAHLSEKHFLRKHGPGATYGQAAESR
ncbi:MAG: class II aldolase/adducin family protein [Terrimicrobiaceae bacterium]|nr:class II aldolase/adducin family protein [Terrimicrobiaceae bacterium]